MKTTSLASTRVSAKSSTAWLNPVPRRMAQPPCLSTQRPLPQSTRDPSKTRSRIRVLLVDDHPVVRKGISSCLARHDHLHIVGEAADGREAVAKAKELLPDIVLLDIDLPQMSGLGVAEVLRKELPNSKVLILSGCERAEYLPRMLQSGARGYVLKGASPEELAKAIEIVTGGECYFSPRIARLAINRVVQGNGVGPDPKDLTDREREVLVLVAGGLSNKEVSTQLDVGVRTVETHRERIMRKLGIHSIAGLTRFALAKGLITLRDELRR
jgi:two-component system, NarL family, nitrate/nitrite response regulator NarL